jgi:uncharacterized protein YdhG (YjbR/CyaY superfamily)
VTACTPRWQHRAVGLVDDAIADVAGPARDALQHVVDLARSLAPDAVDGVSYGMPALKVAGKPLISVIAAAHHLSVFPFSGSAVDAVRRRLDGWSLSKGTIRFSADHPVPDDVLVDLVRARLAEIESSGRGRPNARHR